MTFDFTKPRIRTFRPACLYYADVLSNVAHKYEVQQDRPAGLSSRIESDSGHVLHEVWAESIDAEHCTFCTLPLPVQHKNRKG